MRKNIHNHSTVRGAALLLALGMLTILSVLGAAYVLSLQLDTESAGMRLMKIRAAHAAEAGVQYALGDLLRAADPARATGERRYEIGVYGPVRMSSRIVDTTARMTNHKVFARVAVDQVSASNYPVGAEGSAVAAKILPGEGRLFRIVSEGVAGKTTGGGDYGRTTVRTVALVLLRAEGPQFVYWNSGPETAAAPKAG